MDCGRRRHVSRICAAVRCVERRAAGKSLFLPYFPWIALADFSPPRQLAGFFIRTSALSRPEPARVTGLLRRGIYADGLIAASRQVLERALNTQRRPAPTGDGINQWQTPAPVVAVSAGRGCLVSAPVVRHAGAAPFCHLVAPRLQNRWHPVPSSAPIRTCAAHQTRPLTCRKTLKHHEPQRAPDHTLDADRSPTGAVGGLGAH